MVPMYKRSQAFVLALLPLLYSTFVFSTPDTRLNRIDGLWKEASLFCKEFAKRPSKLEGLDVAFVEGAIASARERKFVEKIRKNCKRLVAIGSCACTGMPSAQRNTFDKKRKDIEEKMNVYQTKTILKDRVFINSYRNI